MESERLLDEAMALTQLSGDRLERLKAALEKSKTQPVPIKITVTAAMNGVEIGTVRQASFMLEDGRLRLCGDPSMDVTNAPGMAPLSLQDSHEK